MPTDLLQQLRDLHLPADPIWWPPAPGWWLLAILLLVAIVYGYRSLVRTIARRRPIRQARLLYEKLYSDYQKGLLDGPTYLHQANELLKRLFIYGLHEDRARKANDASWLEFLDQQSGSRAFTEGPGAQLGNQRFRVHADADPQILHPILEQLFKSVRP